MSLRYSSLLDKICINSFKNPGVSTLKIEVLKSYIFIFVSFGSEVLGQDICKLTTQKDSQNFIYCLGELYKKNYKYSKWICTLQESRSLGSGA